MPTWHQRRRLDQEFPDALLFMFPKRGHSLARDFKWLGSHRYGIVHLGGRDVADLQRRCLEASALLGWPAPLHHDWERPAVHGRLAPAGAPVLAHARPGP